MDVYGHDLPCKYKFRGDCFTRVHDCAALYSPRMCKDSVCLRVIMHSTLHCLPAIYKSPRSTIRLTLYKQHTHLNSVIFASSAQAMPVTTELHSTPHLLSSRSITDGRDAFIFCKGLYGVDGIYLFAGEYYILIHSLL